MSGSAPNRRVSEAGSSEIRREGAGLDDAVTKLLSWGGVIFTSLVAFILPFVLTWHVLVEDGDSRGSVTVYFGWLTSHKAELRSVKILLVLAVAAVLVAIIGNFV